jgi:hypothetical protein
LTVVRNPFPPDLKEEIRKIVEPSIFKIKRNINVKYVNNAATFIDEKALIKQKEEHEFEIDAAKNRSNLKDFSSYLERIKSTVVDELTKILKDVYPNMRVRLSGSFLYPDTGYMGWHTNHLDPCKRIYIVYAEEAQRSFFRYEEDGKIITDFDDLGLTIREFDIPSTQPYFWHCVGSTCNRFSFGFRIEGAN